MAKDYRETVAESSLSACLSDNSYKKRTLTEKKDWRENIKQKIFIKL